MADDSNLGGSNSTGEEHAEHERFSYRCHTCSIEFSIIEEFLAHVTENHSNSDGTIDCIECQEQLANSDG